jgi:hypothetical protein
MEENRNKETVDRMIEVPEGIKSEDALHLLEYVAIKKKASDFYGAHLEVHDLLCHATAQEYLGVGLSFYISVQPLLRFRNQS